MADDDTTTHVPRRALLAALWASAGAAVLGILLTVIPVRYVQVNVRWTSEAPASWRDNRAARWSLIFIRPDDADTGIYLLRDTSRENIRGILSDPAIAAVRFLDRSTLQPTEHQLLPAVAWLGLRYPWFVARWLRPAGVLPLFGFFFVAALCLTREGRRWMASRIPPIAPASMGAFRIIFALALLPAVWRTVPWSVLAGGVPLRPICLTLLASFGMGLTARLSFIGLTTALTVAHWSELGGHDFALPIKTMWLMTLVPWGDGLSVDEAIRRLRGRATPQIAARRYGLAIWIPVFMVGIAYLAAAFAKIDENAQQWLFGGAARYFLVVDADNAPARIGLALASSDRLSALLSMGAVCTESLVIAGALSTSSAVRAVAGLGTLMLHLGFFVFQGIWWPFWWALMPAFLPIHAVVSRWQATTGPLATSWIARLRTPIRTPGGAVPMVAGTALCVMALQQPVVSFLRVEHSPFYSDFPMYSDVNWRTKDEFAADRDAHYQPPPAVRLQPLDDTSGELLASRLRTLDGSDVVTAVARSLAAGEPPSSLDSAQLQALAARYRAAFGSPAPRVAILTDGWRFDWSIAGFAPRGAWQRGPTLDLATGTVVE